MDVFSMYQSARGVVASMADAYMSQYRRLDDLAFDAAANGSDWAEEGRGYVLAGPGGANQLRAQQIRARLGAAGGGGGMLASGSQRDLVETREKLSNAQENVDSIKKHYTSAKHNQA